MDRPLGLEKVVAARSRAHALRLAQQHAQVPRVGRGGTDILVAELNSESRGKITHVCALEEVR